MPIYGAEIWAPASINFTPKRGNADSAIVATAENDCNKRGQPNDLETNTTPIILIGDVQNRYYIYLTSSLNVSGKIRCILTRTRVFYPNKTYISI